MLTISTCRGSRLVGAEAGTAKWIFFLSLDSPSTSVDMEGSIALDPGGLTPSGEEVLLLKTTLTFLEESHPAG